MIVNELKEVYYDIYCPQCEHHDQPEEEEPCWHCLNEPVNVNSHKPVEFKEAER